jgi:alcohol dehydrogenase class IV
VPTIAAPGSELDTLFAGSGATELALPRRLLTGDGTLARLGDALTRLEVPPGPVFCVADAAVAELGVAELAIDALRSAGYEPGPPVRAAGEPDLAAAADVVAHVRERPYVAVVGLGGGSALDPAKLAAGLATNPGGVEEYTAGQTIDRPPLPLALVPTTAGTGAEASRNAIVTLGDRKAVVGSPLLVPLLAVLDPLLVVSCPPAVTAASGLDALAHAFEATLSTWATPLTTLNALAAAASLARWLPAAVEDGSDLPARRATLTAAHQAGLALNASALLGHSLAYTIAARTHLPHGVTTAVALPYCVAYAAGAAPAPTRLLARAVGAEASGLARWTQAFAGRLGVRGSLAELGIPESELPAMVDECLEAYPRPNNPRRLDRERLLELYRCFHAGDLDAAVEAFS